VLFDGVPELLAGLAGDGYLLAVATGKSRRGLDHALAQGGLGALFHATRTADEAPSKPYPQMIWDILEELGVKAESALMIGDSVHDLEMARAAGVAALGVASGAHGRRDLEAQAPLACLGAVAELPAWLAAVATSTATP
jgi:phosphoglycolate phosphatase